MNKDGAVECLSEDDGSRSDSNSLNYSPNKRELTVHSSSFTTGELKLKISYWKKSNDDEVDNSFGTNLKNHSDSLISQDYSNDGNMDIKRSEPAANDCNSTLAACHKSLVVKSEENNPALSVKESIRFKGSSENVKVTSKSHVDMCDTTKPSGILKPVKNAKSHNSNCRSSIQDVHDSCLRMDVLPNVSPDSGIVSFEGSPFGNESPHSTPGPESSQEISQLPTSSLDLSKESKATVDPRISGSIQSSVLDVSQEPMDISQPISPLPSSGVHCKEMQIDDINGLPVKISKVDDTDKVKDDPNVGEVFVNVEEKEKPPYEPGANVESETKTADFISSSSTKNTSPSWQKKKGSSVKRTKFQEDHRRSRTVYSKIQLERAGNNSVGDENTIEKCEDNVNENISDTNGNKVKKLQTCEREVYNLSKDCALTKRSPGRPKGSLNRSYDPDPTRRTDRKHVPKHIGDESIGTSPKDIQPHISDEQMVKRPRGRPRKVITSDELKSKLIVKKKVRKKIFTRLKKTCNKAVRPYIRETQSKGNKWNNNNDESFGTESEDSKKSGMCFQHSPPKLFSDSNTKSLDLYDTLSSKKSKETFHNVSTLNGKVEKSDFSDKDLEALLKSVKSSISSQFTSDKDNEETASSLSFDNPFKSAKKPSFPQLPHSHDVSSVRPKPKYKKPKLHVMMRKTKRKKRKKVEPSVPAPTGGFGASSPEKGLSFFTSRVQPSKLLASSRLNVFQTGTGVESNRSGTPTDGEQTEGSEKRLKKRRKLLNFKSKHRNIIDPVFAADLDLLESGVKYLAISENLADNFIRVRPGEMPLPTIFRVIKIDVMKRMKEKMVLEPCNLETSKPLKFAKKEIAVQDVINPLSKILSKTVRKKSLFDQIAEGRDQTSLSDSSDQWLPPKKRHRMVHMDDTMPILMSSIGAGSVASSSRESSHPSERKKGRRQRRTDGDGSIAKARNLDQVLTIDTSSYSTAGSSVSTLTPSPCPSRQSTRSSTIPSLSSLSPSESSSVYGRHNSKFGSTLTCPQHPPNTSSQDDILSCSDCQLHRRSGSSFIHSNYSLPRSLSNNSVELNSVSFDHSISSSEPSPSLKYSKVLEEQSRRSTRKRRKSTNDTEPSPPRLERHNIISPTSCSDIYSAPPQISPVKRYPSPLSQSSSKKSSFLNQANSSTSGNNKSVENISHRSLRHASFRSVLSDKQLCNTSFRLSHSSSSSVIPELSSSDWQPLPLDQCKNKEIVEEIQAALRLDSSDDSSIEGEGGEEEHQCPSITSQCVPSSAQPPRKRYQRVGLFSDFYKDDEPRKRCENMVRCRDKLVYVKEEHEYGLMPFPIHVGLHNMRQIQDLQLPYDIWWQAYNNQLPKKAESKIKFRTLRSNVYVDGKTSCRKAEIPACSCKPSPSDGRGCLDDCLNRMIYTECSIPNCPLGDNCGNQRIQKHDWSGGIEKFLTSDRGFGVIVTKPVKTGQFILEYLGEVISEVEFRRRMMEEYSEECHHYALHLDSGNVIDGYRMGNIGRYVNHSCQPNCEMQKWNVNGLYRMVLVALRDIGAYEELSYDYNFDAFNQETQQECRCGSKECRGVIGGKAQRYNNVNKQEKMSDDSKDKRKSKFFNKKAKEKMSENVLLLPPTRTMTYKERCYARKHSMFLVRNVDKVLNQRHPGQVFAPPIPKEEVVVPKVNCVTSDVLLANLTESSVKTRLASFAKDNPEVLRRHQLAQLFDKILTELLSLKDQEGNSMVTPLMSLPSRKKQPQYYQIVKEPIDMSIIKQRVKTGHYDHLKTFNADVMLLFSNVELYCGPKSDMGQVILKLRHIFSCAMQDLSLQIDEILGLGTTKTLMDLELAKLAEAGAKVNKEPEEDIIRCICGVTRDEGLMLQCEKCMRWQHCDCVRASGKEEHYLCDRCEPRYYDPEILLAPSLTDTLPDCTHFMTLVKEDVQYAVGDCVYVMRDCKRSATGTPIRASHRLIASSNPDSLDIFRIDQLWKDPKGERFASGTPYLRPQETFHEPTRKFLHNELFRTPNYEIIPLDLVMGKCVVMDPTTYCKGRPKGIKEQDVYVCEYRVDKTAHLFHKIKEIWYPFNTSRFCFDWFEQKLALKRTFAPHEIPEHYRRKAERNSNSAHCGKVSGKEDVVDKKHDPKKCGKDHHVMHGKVKMDESLKNDIKLKAEVKVNVKKGSDLNSEVKLELKQNFAKLMEMKRQEKRARLDGYCLKLLNNIPGKQKVDLSYLLDDGRRVRKKLIK